MNANKIRIPFPQRLADFRRGPLVLLVWFAVAFGVGFLLWEQPRAARHLGWIPPVESEVTRFHAINRAVAGHRQHHTHCHGACQ